MLKVSIFDFFSCVLIPSLSSFLSISNGHVIMILISDTVITVIFHFHFSRWRMLARKDRKARNKERTDLLEKMFACWCLFVPLQKTRRELGIAVENKYFSVAHNFKVEKRECMISWFSLFNRNECCDNYYRGRHNHMSELIITGFSIQFYDYFCKYYLCCDLNNI